MVTKIETTETTVGAKYPWSAIAGFLDESSRAQAEGVAALLRDAGYAAHVVLRAGERDPTKLRALVTNPCVRALLNRWARLHDRPTYPEWNYRVYFTNGDGTWYVIEDGKVKADGVRE